MVINSVDSPSPVIKTSQAAGCFVFADVASVRHAHNAIDAGADGLILLTARAGGKTGWLNGFARAKAVRAFFDGPVVLAGGVADGAALAAARTLGGDLAYVGTKCIATDESLAEGRNRQMVIASTADDIVPTREITGITASMWSRSMTAARLDLATFDESNGARALFNQAKDSNCPEQWKDIGSVGHAVSEVTHVISVAELVATTERQYHRGPEYDTPSPREPKCQFIFARPGWTKTPSYIVTPYLVSVRRQWCRVTTLRPRRQRRYCGWLTQILYRNGGNIAASFPNVSCNKYITPGDCIYDSTTPPKFVRRDGHRRAA
jgi:hypothetical protein